MRLVKLLSLFISASCSTLTSVESLPYEGAVYVMDAQNKGAQRSTRISVDCTKPENKGLCFVPWELMDNFMCVAPEDSMLFMRR